LLPVGRHRRRPSPGRVAATLTLLPLLALASVFIEKFPIGDGVGYTANPVDGSPCLDIDDVNREGGSQNIVGGTCNGSGCKDCAFDKCDEKPLDGPPYAVACPSTCKLKTPSTDIVNDKCTNDRGAEITFELECVSFIGFMKMQDCDTSALSVTPTLSPTGQDDKSVAPAFPPGDGVGYTVSPEKGSPCPNSEFYLIVGGECNGLSCDCVEEKDLCDNGMSDGILIPYAVTCPELCELTTPSQNVEVDKCASEELGTHFVKCINGIFERMEQCYAPDVTSSPTPAPTPAPTPRPILAPSEPEICGISKSEYLKKMLSFLSKFSDSSFLSIPNTPQYLSKTWLIDSGVCSDDDETAREMYVFGVMFYGWGIGHLLRGGRAELCGYIGIQCQKIDTNTGKLLQEIGANEKIDPEENFRFTKVLMRKRNLTGKIPHEIKFLTTLNQLDLSENSLSGKIPSVLEQLQGLTYLNLARNHLKGTIPEEIYSLNSLRLLALDRNELSGTLSNNVGNLLDLEILWLFSNKFIGLLPNPLGELKYLKELHLDQNMLEGQCNANLCRSVNYGRLKDFRVDCNSVRCNCAMHCHASSNNQHFPALNNPNNSWGQPQPANPQPQRWPMNPNVHPGERYSQTKRRCLCDVFTGSPCIGQRLACGNGMPCDTRQPCGGKTYVCDACGPGSVRGAARCVCDYGSRRPCVPMAYPACGRNTYECNLCG